MKLLIEAMASPEPWYIICFHVVGCWICSGWMVVKTTMPQNTAMSHVPVFHVSSHVMGVVFMDVAL